MAAGWMEIRATGPCEGKEEAALLLIRAGSPGVLEEAGPGGTEVGRLVQFSRWEDEIAQDACAHGAISYRAYIDGPSTSGIEGLEAGLRGIGWEITLKSPYKDRNLAIAAKKLGIERAVGTEIDPVALRVARKNARGNGAALKLTGRPVAAIRGSFDIVVANILAGSLIGLSADISAKVGIGGFLILSGILREEADNVRGAYSSLGLKPRRSYLSGEWAALVFRR
ncbi:MAG: 50S ribosomal protein L11 methyltransferase [Deltaproteobacteria bacterium]|nr:50S ribosomal protein L11 methyltransferase [Deltaproteobacteria bacterium]